MATEEDSRDPASLLELVEDRASDSQLSGKNRAAILAHKEEIADVLARGYKWKVVWQALMDGKRINMSYATFRMHCRAVGLDLAPQTYRTNGPGWLRKGKKDGEP